MVQLLSPGVEPALGLEAVGLAHAEAHAPEAHAEAHAEPHA